MTKALRAALLVSASLIALPSRADEGHLEEIEVHGRNLSLLGQAMAGSSGTVGYEDFKNRPIARVGEILEVVPGMIATQHSGTGKANQYFLRGFNLDHGTDFAGFVDDAPVNMRSHGHGQGYLDLNFLIPELVEKVDFRKGPAHVDMGDFATAGAASIRTYDRLEEGIAELGIGEFGYRRGVAAGSAEIGGVTILGALEGHLYDSPFELDEDLEKINAFVKLSGGDPDLRWRVSLGAYDASWKATDQVPERAIEAGLISPLGHIDPDLGGRTERYSLNASVETPTARATAYMVDYSFNLWSDFTYLAADPVRGDEFEQVDRRRIYGVRGHNSWALEGGIVPLTLTVGGDVRYDDIAEVGLYGTEARVRHTRLRDDRLGELSLAGWGKLSASLTEMLRAEIGLRADRYSYDVTAAEAANSGTGSDAIVSPTVALAWKASDRLELYANYGEGFHSNDARGAAINLDPATGDPADPVPLLVKARGAEAGARLEAGAFKATLVGFWLDLGSELVFVGDAGTTEPNDGSKRLGVEATAFWQATDWMNLHAAYAGTRARFRGVAAGEDRIPGAVPAVMSLGTEIEPLDGLTVSLLLRHFASAPLIEDGSVRSDATTAVNAGAYYELQGLRLGVELLNALDSGDPDISYFYESQLPGEAAPVADRHIHPLEPRQVRVSLRYGF